jgi:hypothetical protein
MAPFCYPRKHCSVGVRTAWRGASEAGRAKTRGHAETRCYQRQLCGDVAMGSPPDVQPYVVIRLVPESPVKWGCYATRNANAERLTTFDAAASAAPSP